MSANTLWVTWSFPRNIVFMMQFQVKNYAFWHSSNLQVVHSLEGLASSLTSASLGKILAVGLPFCKEWWLCHQNVPTFAQVSLLAGYRRHTVYIVPVASSLLTNPSFALCVCVWSLKFYTAAGDPNVVINHPGRQPLIRSVIQSNFFKTGTFGTSPSYLLVRCPGL